LVSFFRINAVISLVWVVLFGALFFIDFDGTITFLEVYVSPDNQIDNPKQMFFRVLTYPALYTFFLFLILKSLGGLGPFSLKTLLMQMTFVFFHVASFEWFRRYTELALEDRFFEASTALLSLLAGGLFLVAGIKGAKIAFILALGWILFGLEEISWGSRIFSIDSPDFFKNYNYQEEINFHNFLNPILDDLYIVLNITILLFFTSFRDNKYLKSLYLREDVSLVIKLSDKYCLWVIILCSSFLSLMPLVILNFREVVEQQWAIFGLLLSILFVAALFKR
jgi:hypothetical protein